MLVLISQNVEKVKTFLRLGANFWNVALFVSYRFEIESGNVIPMKSLLIQTFVQNFN